MGAKFDTSKDEARVASRFDFDEEGYMHAKTPLVWQRLTDAEHFVIALWHTKLIPFINEIRKSLKAQTKRLDELVASFDNKAKADKAAADAIEARLVALEKATAAYKAPKDKYPGTDPANRGR